MKDRAIFLAEAAILVGLALAVKDVSAQTNGPIACQPNRSIAESNFPSDATLPQQTSIQRKVVEIRK